MTRTRLFLTIALLMTSTGVQAAGADAILVIPFMLLFFASALNVVVTTLLFIGVALFQADKFRSRVAFRALTLIAMVLSVLYLLAFGFFEWANRTFVRSSLFELEPFSFF